MQSSVVQEALGEDIPIFSADSHIMEPLDMWSSALGDRFGDKIPHVLDSYQGQNGIFLSTGRQVLKLKERGGAVADKHADLYEAGFKPEKRVEFQKAAGVAGEAIYGSYMLPILQNPHRDALRASCEVFNDWLAEFCSYDASRLLGVAMIPIDDVDWAIKELERMAKKNMRGACINCALPPEVTPYRDAKYDPFWARAQEMDFPITLHSITGQLIDPFYPDTQRQKEEAPAGLIKLAYEAQDVLANDFIFGGILDRFPKLKLICSEFEISWVPYFTWKSDHMMKEYQQKMDLPKLRQLPSEYMGTQIWHGYICDPMGPDVIRFMGPESIIWGSDFPHVRSVGFETREALEETFRGFEKADVRKLIYGNAAKVYNF